MVGELLCTRICAALGCNCHGPWPKFTAFGDGNKIGVVATGNKNTGWTKKKQATIENHH